VTVEWSYEPAGAEPDPELARAIARKLCSESLAWARTIVVTTWPLRGRLESASAGIKPKDSRSAPRRVQLEDDLFVEVLAYGLRLLEMRLGTVSPASQDGFARLVRQECSLLVGQASWRRAHRYKPLSASGSALSESRYVQLYPPPNAQGGPQARLTKEMFDQFCHCTGLGSDVLVGKGENLASLVFYIAVHGVLSARGLPTREEVLRLLRAASECRTQMQRAIPGWLSPVPRSQPDVSLPGPAIQAALPPVA
jgi:hypothetical protein